MRAHSAWRTVLCLLLTLVPALLPAATAAAPAAEAGAGAASAEGLTADEQEALAELFALNRELDAARAALADLDRRGAELATELEATRQELSQVEVLEEKRQEQVARRLRYLQRHGGLSYLGMLLKAESLRDFMDRVEMLTFVMDQDQTLLAEYRSVAAAATEEETLLAQQQQEWAAIREAQARRERELAQAVAEKEAILAGLKDRRGEVEAALSDLEQDWTAAAMPVLEALGSALLTLDVDTFEPDELQITILPPGALVHISEARLNGFLTNNRTLRQMAFAVEPDKVTLAGTFDGIPVRVEGKAGMLEKNVLRFQPTLMQVRDFTVPQRVIDEIVAEGWLDIDLSAMADPYSVYKAWTEADELILRAGF